MILPEAATWHYVVAQVIFAGLGVIGHVGRAVFNVLPDRLSDSPTMDMMVSDGFDWYDYLTGVEYDDNGYYRLDSMKNLRVYVQATMIGGFGCMLFMPDAAGAVAMIIDWSLAAIRDLFFLRLQEYGIG